MQSQLPDSGRSWAAAFGRDCEVAPDLDSGPTMVITWRANGSCQRARCPWSRQATNNYLPATGTGIRSPSPRTCLLTQRRLAGPLLPAAAPGAPLEPAPPRPGAP